MDKIIKGALSAIGAGIGYLVGSLGGALLVLAAVMLLDYISGFVASAIEGHKNPEDISKGLNSKKGWTGIGKKVLYLIIVAAAIGVDWLLGNVSSQVGITLPHNAIFGMLTTMWFIINEILSILENAGRAGIKAPSFLTNIITALKGSIEDKGNKED